MACIVFQWCIYIINVICETTLEITTLSTKRTPYRGIIMNKSQHKTIYRKDYTAPLFLVDEVMLDFLLEDAFCIVRATTRLYRNSQSEDTSDTLFLDGEELELLHIAVDGRELSEADYQVNDKGLTLLSVPDRFVLEVTTKIYPDQNSALEGLYRSSGNYCTQCEAEGFRKITYYLDRPDVMAKFTTRIEGDIRSCPVLLSNGNKVDAGTVSATRHFAVYEDPFPKPCYLFALVAGDLVALEDSYVTMSGKTISLQIYVQTKNSKQCGHAMESLKKSMQWDEEVFGLEYDLDTYMIVAVDDFNMGAMENKGLNIFNSKYVLASPETATDQDYLGVEGVIAHEYFHNWTGNRVTCRDWFQLSLKEGLTVFRDQEFSSDMNSRPVKRIDDVRILRNFQFREDAGPMAHPVRPDSYVEINNFYTVTVYNKGAEVIRMMHSILGAENFRKGMDLYFKRHDGQAVTCDDFVAAMADASGISLDQFSRWYAQSGTPVIGVDEEWSEQSQRYTLTLTQQGSGKPFLIPVAIGLVDSEGEDMEIGDTLLTLEQERQVYQFENIKEKPVLSLFRAFSAPVKVNPWQSREQLAFLMGHDRDSFNRWDASFRLSESVILENAVLIQQKKEPVIDPLYVEAVGNILADEKSDKSLLAMALSLPEESYLAQQMEVIDPDALHQARLFVRQQLAELCKDGLQQVWQKNREDGSYSLDPEAMGRRRLKNVCLSLLLSAKSPEQEDIIRAKEQFYGSTNMTDTIAALSAFVQSSLSERNALLDDFYTKWKDEQLVMDKWLMLQAGRGASSTLQAVKALMDHPAFSMSNPNKIRSLIGAFGANHYCFHALDGGGYRFLADQIITLNKSNPQIASRLTTPFAAWRRYDTKRQEMVQKELKRILATDGLSGDVYEMVKRSLG